MSGEEWPPVRVTISDTQNPFFLKLLFGHTGKGAPFLGFEVEATSGLGIDPRSFARLARNLPMYVDYVRALIELSEGDREQAVESLRTVAGRSRRGLPDAFYREIAAEYIDLVAGGVPHPIKTIAERRPVDKSRASRWVKEARARGYITTNGGEQQ